MFKKNEFPIIPDIPTIELIFITYNRIYYTEQTLPLLLNSTEYPFKVQIVDNGSTDGTVDYLRKLNHPNIKDIIFNKKNQGLVKPTKKFWKQTSADLIGKIDNDILVPPKWIDNLILAHKKIPRLGVIGYSHFRKDDYLKKKVKAKVSTINGIHLRQQPWIGGNYILKKSTILNHKGYRESRKIFKQRILYGFNKYQEKLTMKGFINGYLCDQDKSLYTWDHIDDPRHHMFHKNENYYKIRGLSEEEIINWYKKDAKNLLE